MNYLVSVFYFLVTLAGIAIIVMLAVREQEKRFLLPLSLIVFLLAALAMMSGLFYLTHAASLGNLLLDFETALTGYLSVSIFFFVMRFYSIDRYYTSLIATILCALPTTLLLNGLVKNTAWFDNAVEIPPYLYWCNIVFYMMILIFSLIISLNQYARVPDRYKKASRQLMAGLVLIAAGILIDTMILRITVYHRVLFFGIFAIVFFYIAARKNIGLDYLNVARSDVFNELDDAIFILDVEGLIVNRNTAAKYLLFCEGLDTNTKDIRFAFSKVFGITPSELPFDGTDRTEDFNTTVKAKNDKVYSIQEKMILDRTGDLIGRIFICTDVSVEYGIITRIELQSGIDPLTGVLNRDLLMQRYDDNRQSEVLPLGVIFGDLNGLKKINDTEGHHYGDILIRTAAEILIKCSPPKADVFRYGGDEFVVVIPNYTEADCNHLVEIYTSYLGGDRFQVPVAISFGYAVRTSLDETLEDVIHRADAEMYRNKQLSRAAAK